MITKMFTIIVFSALMPFSVLGNADMDDDLLYLQKNLFNGKKEKIVKNDKKSIAVNSQKEELAQVKKTAEISEEVTPRYDEIQDIEALYFDTVKTKASAIKKKRRIK